MSKLVAFALVALAALSMVTGAPIFPRQNPHGGRDSSVHWVSLYAPLVRSPRVYARTFFRALPIQLTFRMPIPPLPLDPRTP